MIIGRVTGTVVATRKAQVYEGKKILRVQPLDLEGQDVDRSFLAYDSVDAGEGDVVLVVREGGSANLVAGTRNQPLDDVIVGIVDRVELDGEPVNHPPPGRGGSGG